MPPINAHAPGRRPRFSLGGLGGFNYRVCAPPLRSGGGRGGATFSILRTLMNLKILAPIILALFPAISSLSASTNGFHDIATQSRAKFAAAQAGWQRGLAELVIRARPDFRTIASVQRDLQVAYVEQGTVRFRYLLEHDPNRVILTNGVSGLANFAWTDSDTQSLAKVDPSYLLLQKRIATLEKQNDQEPDWPKFRAWFRETFSRNSDYQALLTDFQARQKEVEELLGKYKP